MKRIYTTLLFAIIGLTLFACGPDEIVVDDAPVFSHLIVEGREPAINGELDTYLIDKNDEITVEVHFDNPQGVQINSVTISGQTYRSNRFEADPMYQTLTLNLRLRVPGDITFTLDSFLHSGTENVSVENDNQYRVFVRKTVPTATLVSLTSNTSSIHAEIRINDEDDVIILDSVHAILYRDNEEVDRVTLERAALNLIDFTDLLSDGDYDLIVVADYDRDDGEGVREAEVLLTLSDIRTDAKTPPSASISATAIHENALIFNVTTTDPFSVIDWDSVRVELWHGDTLVETLDDLEPGDLSALAFDGLLNNNTYTLEVYANYDLGDAEGLRENVKLATLSVNTLQTPLPDINISVVTTGTSHMIVRVDTTASHTDLSNVRIRLYDVATDTHIRTISVVEAIEDIEILDLLANRQYRLDVIAEFDLGDGQGARVDVINSLSHQTNTNQRPAGAISAISFTQTSVQFSYSLTNPNQTALAGTFIARLYEDNVLIDTKVLALGSGQETFEGIDVDHTKTYSVTLKTNYDLRDGDGVVEDHFLASRSKSVAIPKAPDGDILDITITPAGIRIDYAFFDTDDTLVEDGLVLEFGGDVHTLDPNDDHIIIPTYQNNRTYTVRLKATYNLNNAPGETVLDEIDFNVPALTTPSLSLDSTLSGTTISGDAVLSDADDTIISYAIIILRGGTEIDRVEDTANFTFTSLLNDTEYTIILTAEYDLNDGEGTQTAAETLSHTTEALASPSASLDASVSGNTIDGDAAFDDDDATIVGYHIAVLLDGVEVERIDDAATVSFTDLRNNTEYNVILTVEYDLNDGEGTQTLTQTQTLTTAVLATPIGELSGVSHALRAFDVDTAYSDEDDVIVGGVEAVLYEGETEVARQVVGLTDTVTFTDLDAETEYTLRLEATIDMNDGEGEQVIVIESMMITTPSYQPIATATQTSIQQERANLQVELDDPYGVLTGDPLWFELRDQNDLLVGSTQQIEDNLKIHIFNLWSNYEYTIHIYANVDYDDGEGVKSERIGTDTFTTSAKQTPSASINDIEVDGDDLIIFMSGLSDPDEITSRLVLELYVDGVLDDTIIIDHETLNAPDEFTFVGKYDADADLVVKLRIDYDANDSLGTIEDVLLDRITVIIAEKNE